MSHQKNNYQYKITSNSLSQIKHGKLNRYVVRHSCLPAVHSVLLWLLLVPTITGSSVTTATSVSASATSAVTRLRFGNPSGS